VSLFTSKLASYAGSGGIIALETLTARLTVDIVAMLTVHKDVDIQSGRPHVLVETMTKLLYYSLPIDSFNLFWIYSPYRVLMHKYYVNKMDGMTGKIIDRYEERGSPEKGGR
jgi:hypothetical protein